MPFLKIPLKGNHSQMNSPSFILQDEEPPEKLNVNQSRTEVTCAVDMYPSITPDSNGVAHSLYKPRIFDAKNDAILNAVHDTRAPKTKERSEDDSTDGGLVPDIIAETQKKDSRTNPNMMTNEEEQEKYQDVSQSLHKTQSTSLEMPSGDDDSNFMREFIDLHNKCRAKHSIPPLELSLQLSVFSQNWAESLAERSVMQNSNMNLGENIFYKSGSEMDPNEPIYTWYKEGIDYPYGSTDFHHKTGHFTQMVWKESQHLGVGIAKSPSTGSYVVANYYPPGNVQGRFPFNVLPPYD